MKNINGLNNKLTYFKHKEIVSSALHLVAVFLSIAGLVLLIVLAAKYSTTWHVVAYSIYGSSMILLYLASTVYHSLPYQHEWKEFWRMIDHSMIYVLIAGTYTPICLVVLRGGWGWSMFGIIWGLALTGVIIKTIKIRLPNWLSVVIYIFIGWLITIALMPLIKLLPPFGLWWLMAGGIFYTVGTIFIALEKTQSHRWWFDWHEVWHLFVMGGSFAHWWLMLKYVMYTNL